MVVVVTVTQDVGPYVQGPGCTSKMGNMSISERKIAIKSEKKREKKEKKYGSCGDCHTGCWTLFSGFRVHFQKWKHVHISMKNSDKIRKKREKNSSGGHCHT